MVDSKTKTKPEAGQCDTPEGLVQWIEYLCEGWQERDADVLCVAHAGEAFADENSIEAGVFRTIRQNLDDTRIEQEIIAAVRKLAEMAKGASHG